MDKYINASATIKELEMYRMPETVDETDMELINRKAHNTMLEIAKMVVNSQPVADVEPVRHGHWIVHERVDEMFGFIIPNFECSECHTFVRPDGMGKRCLECGAKMDKKV